MSGSSSPVTRSRWIERRSGEYATHVPSGASVSAAQVFLVAGGTFNVTTAEAFQDAFGEQGDGATHQGFVFKGEPFKLSNVQPGSYSACAIPIPGDINSPADMMKIQGHMDKLIVKCQPATVAPAPPDQAINIAVPVPPPL